MKWHSIKVYVRFSLINSLRYLTFSSVCAVFIPLLTHAHQPVYRLLSLSKASSHFPEISNNCSVSKTKLLQCFDPSFTFVRYFTHNQSYRPVILTWNTEELEQCCHCYVACKHKNNGVTTCCSITLNNKLNFFCSAVKFVLEVWVSVNLTYVK